MLGNIITSIQNKTNSQGLKSTQVDHARKSFGTQAYLFESLDAIWSERDYHQFAEQAFRRNVVAHRCMEMIAGGVSSVDWQLFHVRAGKRYGVQDHPIKRLLKRPNPSCAGSEFFESLVIYKLLSGNSYIQAVSDKSGLPKELHVLRPDRVTIVPGEFGIPKAYRYRIHTDEVEFPIDPVSGACQILHLRHFHPENDWYGLSPVEAASYSIDQHNQAAIWNQSLLQNGARPTGALVIKGTDGQPFLSEAQFARLKQQVEEDFCGNHKAGRPLLLEGGLDWKEMGHSNRDMDFMEAKNGAARDIALAFGVPPQLLGIPGDNTYRNMQEARLALWEETIIPLLNHIADALNHWLVHRYGKDLLLDIDRDSISVLATRREQVWARIQQADFLTVNEKRAAVGFPPLSEGDTL